MDSRTARRNNNQCHNNKQWQKRFTEIIPLEESWKRIILQRENIKPLQEHLARASVTNDRRTKQLILLLQDTNKEKLLQACRDVTELINNIKKHNSERRVKKRQQKQARSEEKLRQKLQKAAEEKKQYEWKSSASAFGHLHESSDEEEEMPEQENIHGLQFLEQSAPTGIWKRPPQITPVKKTNEELAACEERGVAFLARVKARKATSENKSWADIADDHDAAQKTQQKTQQKKVSWADMADSSDDEDSDDEW